MPHSDKNLLGQVLRRARVAKHFCDRTNNPRLVALDQFLKGTLITRRRSLHEFGILGGHHEKCGLRVVAICARKV